VIVTDDGGRVAFMNGVAQQLVGWSAEAAKQRPIVDIFPIFDEHTDDVAENPIMKALEHRKIVELDNHTILVRRDGSEIPIDDSAAPILNASGAILGAVLSFATFLSVKKQNVRYGPVRNSFAG
jgi:PAS domain S-box-containing protein